MKILFAISHLGIGGAERLVINQIDYLDKKLFDPWLVTLVKDPPENFRKELKLEPEKIKCFEFSGFLDMKSWLKLAGFLRKQKFEAMITNLFMANLILRALAIFLKIPLIISYEHNVYKRKPGWQIFVDRVLARFTDKIITGSKEIRDFTILQEKIPPEKFAIIYNAISLGQINLNLDSNNLRKKLNLPSGVILVTTAGRLIEKKGHLYLIRAAKEVLRGHQQVRFLIFGTNGLRKELEREINNLGLQNFVFLPGFAKTEEIMNLTDIFVMSSLWEGLSIVLLEAMDAGKPIVATKVSGANEVIEDGVNGFLVPIKNPLALAEKIIKLIQNKDLREKLGKKAKDSVKRFSIENNVKNLENLILSLYSNKLKHEKT